MSDTPPPRGLIGRLKTLLPGASDGGSSPHPRWPHRTARWLDSTRPLHGWRMRIDVTDAPEALRTIADRSEGRVDEAAVAEVLDAVANEPEPSSFRFGAPDAFRQVWIGISPEEAGGLRLFLLSDVKHIEAVEAALSVAGFHHPEKRAEYDRLGRFLVAIWEWRGSAAPHALRAEEHDANILAARLQRTVTDAQSPALEVLRGLRRRTRDMIAELAGLTDDEVRRADEWLAARGAPTLSQVRAEVH